MRRLRALPLKKETAGQSAAVEVTRSSDLPLGDDSILYGDLAMIKGL